eukprot:363984-Chlamydomonas_euryale.AAC.18
MSKKGVQAFPVNKFPERGSGTLAESLHELDSGRAEASDFSQHRKISTLRAAWRTAEHEPDLGLSYLASDELRRAGMKITAQRCWCVYGRLERRAPWPVGCDGA